MRHVGLLSAMRELCILTRSGSCPNKRQDRHTHLNCTRDDVGSPERMLRMISRGRVSILFVDSSSILILFVWLPCVSKSDSMMTMWWLTRDERSYKSEVAQYKRPAKLNLQIRIFRDSDKIKPIFKETDTTRNICCVREPKLNKIFF